MHRPHLNVPLIKQRKVFNSIAKDPNGSPSSTGGWPQKHNVTIKVYDGPKVDIQAELTTLSESLEVSNGEVSYGPVVYGINR